MSKLLIAMQNSVTNYTSKVLVKLKPDLKSVAPKRNGLNKRVLVMLVTVLALLTSLSVVVCLTVLTACKTGLNHYLKI